MAAYPTVSAAYGYKPVNLIGGQVFAGSTRNLPVQYNYGTALYYGDLVTLSAGYVVIATYPVSTTNTTVGVFLGCYYTNPVSSDIMFGKKTLLLFYSASCPHCVRELENMRRLEIEFADSLFIVAISTSTHEATMRLLGDHGGVSHIYLDDQRRYARLFGVTAVPAIFLIGEDGRVCYRRVGEAPVAADRQLLKTFRAGGFPNVALGQSPGKEY